MTKIYSKIILLFIGIKTVFSQSANKKAQKVNVYEGSCGTKPVEFNNPFSLWSF